REVGDKVVVHNIHVHRIRGADFAQFGFEVDEVGGENARVDTALGHVEFLVVLLRCPVEGAGSSAPVFPVGQAFLWMSARNMASVRCTCGQSWAVSSWPASRWPVRLTLSSAAPASSSSRSS